MSAANILSPLPGTFYRKPAPDQPEYVTVGTELNVGDVIGLIEVMKSFHEVKADRKGVVKAILVEDSEPVNAGQPLMEIG